MDSEYDVVIVGGGPGGLEAARVLGMEGVSVLVIEKNEVFGRKVCAGGITPKTLREIPGLEPDKSFTEVVIRHGDREARITSREPIVYTIDREKLGEHQARLLKDHPSVKIRKGVAAREILEDRIETTAGTFFYRHVIGADGSLSIVRKSIGLATRRIGNAFQYKIPVEMDEFSLTLDENLFGAWYAWIFPHAGYTFVGTGCDHKYFSLPQARKNLLGWMRERGIDPETGEYQEAVINYDYRGVSFGNRYLVGDAAGLASGLTGEGIYAAIVSARQVAANILGKREDHLSPWLRTKKRHERLLSVIARMPARIRGSFYSWFVSRLRESEKFRRFAISFLI